MSEASGDRDTVARAARIEPQKELVVEHGVVPDEGEAEVLGPQTEQIAPDTGIEMGNAEDAEHRRKSVGEAGGRIDPPAALDQAGPRRRHLRFGSGRGSRVRRIG